MLAIYAILQYIGQRGVTVISTRCLAIPLSDKLEIPTLLAFYKPASFGNYKAPKIV